MFKLGSQIVPGEPKCTEKDVLDHSVLWSQPASWVSATVSWLLSIIAYWCHLRGIWDSPFFASLNLSFIVGLMMGTFHRHSVRMLAVMTAAGGGAVNCSKLCNWLFKSGDRGNTQSYLQLLSKSCWSILSLFHGMFVATALFLGSLFWTSHWKSKVQTFLFHSLFWENCWLLHFMLLHATLKYETLEKFKVFENTWFYWNWFTRTFHWCFLESSD